MPPVGSGAIMISGRSSVRYPAVRCPFVIT